MKCECGKTEFIGIYAEAKGELEYTKYYQISKLSNGKRLKLVGFKCSNCGMEYTLFGESTDY